MLPPAATSAVGPPPTGVERATVARRASMRETEPEYSSATQTDAPLTASATGVLPTAIAGPALSETGSALLTVPSSLFVQ